MSIKDLILHQQKQTVKQKKRHINLKKIFWEQVIAHSATRKVGTGGSGDKSFINNIDTNHYTLELQRGEGYLAPGCSVGSWTTHSALDNMMTGPGPETPQILTRTHSATWDLQAFPSNHSDIFTFFSFFCPRKWLLTSHHLMYISGPITMGHSQCSRAQCFIKILFLAIHLCSDRGHPDTFVLFLFCLVLVILRWNLII